MHPAWMNWRAQQMQVCHCACVWIVIIYMGIYAHQAFFRNFHLGKFIAPYRNQGLVTHIPSRPRFSPVFCSVPRRDRLKRLSNRVKPDSRQTTPIHLPPTHPLLAEAAMEKKMSKPGW